MSKETNHAFSIIDWMLIGFKSRQLPLSIHVFKKSCISIQIIRPLPIQLSFLIPRGTSKQVHCFGQTFGRCYQGRLCQVCSSMTIGRHIQTIASLTFYKCLAWMNGSKRYEAKGMGDNDMLKFTTCSLDKW